MSFKVNQWAHQVSMNEEVPDILLPEREVDSVISSVKTEVSRYELSTNLAIWDSDSDLDMDEIICDVGNDHNYLTALSQEME